jgi:N-acetylglucosaminyldiphosphoundecaprenol N-acetyl-beta-D-mannosaminyltransferase
VLAMAAYPIEARARRACLPAGPCVVRSTCRFTCERSCASGWAVSNQARPWARVRFGQLWIDAVTFAQAMDEIERLVERGQGGSVFTPNVDHVVKVDSDAVFRGAYERCSLSLADGQPVVWASRLLGEGARLPEKVSGSDLVFPLMERAGQRGWRVYLCGGPPGVAEAAAEVAIKKYGVNIVGTESPRMALTANPEDAAIAERVRKANAQLLLVGFGAPKQELFIHRCGDALNPAVSLGIGASLDFMAGRVPRAPRWMSRSGLEWLYRLGKEPRRLWRRYLVEDPKFLLILGRTVRTPRAERLLLPAGTP